MVLLPNYQLCYTFTYIHLQQRISMKRKDLRNIKVKYNNKNDIYFLFKNNEKKDWIDGLLNDDSNIYNLCMEPVEELFNNTGGYLKCLDFSSVYKLAVEITKKQVEKSILKNEKCFFENELNDSLISFNKIKQRLVNNIKNLFDKKRKINLFNKENWIIDTIYKNYEIDTTIWDLEKIAKNNPKVIIQNIINLSKNFEITKDEIIELGEKLDIDFTHLFENELSISTSNIQKDRNNQLILIFDIDIIKNAA